MMERAVNRRTDAMVLTAAALTACVAGLILVEGDRAGYGWEAAAALIIVAAIVLAWADERIGIALFGLSFLGVSNPMLRLEVGGLLIPPPALIAGLLLARELVRRVSGSALRRAPLPLSALLVLVTALVASGLVVVEAPEYLSNLVKWGAHILVFVAMVLVLRESRWIYALTDGLGIVVAAFTAYGLYRVFTGASYYIDVFEGVATRTTASFYLTALLPLVYARVVGASGVERIIRGGLFALLAVGQVFTYTRGGWIASTCGLLFVSGRRVRAYLLFVLVLMLLIVTVPQEVRDRFMSIFIVTDYGVDSQFTSSTVMRAYLLKTGLNVVRNNWLLGVGLGNYFQHYYAYAVPGSPAEAHSPHNFYVYLWAEGGIASVLSFLWFYGGRVRLIWRARRLVSGSDHLALLGFVGSLVAIAVEALAEDDLNLILTWTLLGIGTALAHVVRTSEVRCA
jgi:O-antigen ligase